MDEEVTDFLAGMMPPSSDVDEQEPLELFDEEAQDGFEDVRFDDDAAAAIAEMSSSSSEDEETLAIEDKESIQFHDVVAKAKKAEDLLYRLAGFSTNLRERAAAIERADFQKRQHEAYQPPRHKPSQEVYSDDVYFMRIAEFEEQQRAKFEQQQGIRFREFTHAELYPPVPTQGDLFAAAKSATGIRGGVKLEF